MQQYCFSRPVLLFMHHNYSWLGQWILSLWFQVLYFTGCCGRVWVNGWQEVVEENGNFNCYLFVLNLCWYFPHIFHSLKPKATKPTRKILFMIIICVLSACCYSRKSCESMWLRRSRGKEFNKIQANHPNLDGNNSILTNCTNWFIYQSPEFRQK